MTSRGRKLIMYEVLLKLHLEYQVFLGFYFLLPTLYSFTHFTHSLLLYFVIPGHMLYDLLDRPGLSSSLMANTAHIILSEVDVNRKASVGIIANQSMVIIS